MFFQSATAKSVKADFSKGEITLTFTVPFNDSERETASELARYVDSEQMESQDETAPATAD